MSIIEVKNLHFSYNKDEEILKGIDLIFDEKSTAIIGQNGAGKTTFVKLLKGLLKPTSGDVIIDGKNTKENTVANLAPTIGLVFQNPNDQIFKNNVLSEVMFGPLNIGMNEKDAKESSLNALRMVGLEGKINDNPYDLTLSERKLISIASIVAMNTKIIILDEPTIAQDYISKEKIKDIIFKLKAQGKLIITITHDMDFVAETFERTLVFCEGKVLLDGKTNEVFMQDEELKKAHLEPPYAAQLCRKMNSDKIYITVEEFIKANKR